MSKKKQAEVTVEGLKVAKQTLDKLQDVKIIAKNMYWIGWNADAVDTIIKRADRQYSALVKKYGTLDERSGQIQVLNFIDATDEKGEVIPGQKIINPNVQLFNDEWEGVLLNVESVTYYELTSDMFVNSKGEAVDLSLNQVRGLSFMFGEPL